MWEKYKSLIHNIADRHLIISRFLSIINKAAVNILVGVSVDIAFRFYRVSTEVELQDTSNLVQPKFFIIMIC